MINRDDIEAGDKVYTRDGGCLVAYEDNGVWLGNCDIEGWRFNGDSKISTRLDIIRIEKAPKPVVEEVYVCSVLGGPWVIDRDAKPWGSVIKLTIINGKLEKSEQVK